MTPPRSNDALGPDLFADGELGALMRSVDWSKTPVGDPSGWSQALRTMVGVLLRNRFPMLLWWGPSFVQFYNDAYRPIPGAKHPASLGQPASECWAEIWHIIGPMIEAPFRGEPATWSDDLALLINRKGFLEESHFKVAYSPVPDETVEPSGIGGVLATVAETTEVVFGARQLRTLRELGARATKARTPDQACETSADAFRENPHDVPFALLYLLDEAGETLHLAGNCGVATGGEAVAPPTIAVGSASAWPLERVVRDRRTGIVDDLRARFERLPTGAWDEPPHRAIALPLGSPDQPRLYGVLVAGLSPHRALDGGYQGFFELASAQIVTAIRNARAFQEERSRAEALAAIDRAKTEFFSNVSHEFRTPLTLMLGPTEDALASGTALAGGELDVVHRNQLRLLKLVNNLLDFARLEANRAQASYQPTDLAAVTRDIASSFRSAVERAGLAYRVDCKADAAGERTYVDREMWEKIVLNLLSNALKFTFEGTISVTLEPRPDGVALTVADTGTGIPAEELPHLFERFHRVRGARARTHEGSGIGLALVGELARLHGGQVSVTSEPGRGTAFTVAIPRGAAHLAPDRIGPERALDAGAAHAGAYVAETLRWLPAGAVGPKPIAEAAGAAGADPGPRAHILLADDNADMRDYVGRILERRWSVEAVADGEAALAAARARKPDLILTDVMMPNLDGFGLLRRLRREDDAALRCVPVVMLSARAGEEARVEGLTEGADDYLVKPFSARELVARVETQLKIGRFRITAEQERERLHAILQDLPVAVGLYEGPDLRIMFRNDAAQALVPRPDAIGKPFLEAFPEMAGGSAREALLRVYETGETSVSSEDSRNFDGQERYFTTARHPLRDARGAVVGVMSAAIEISEQVRARLRVEEQTRVAEEARRAAEDAIRAKDEFLAMLGHELRNPLAPILTALQLMQLRGANIFVKERAIIDRQVKHVVRLVDDLLEVSRIARGKISLERDLVDLREVIAQAVELASPLLEQGMHHLSTDVEAQLVVDGDGTRLAQMFANLLTNAAKYTPAGGSIAVTARRLGPAIQIAVKDTGIGIRPELLGAVFDLFVQGPQNADRSEGGLGLGLTIVKAIATLHGGTVEARSPGLGQGSEFVISLPAPADSTEVWRPASAHAERGPDVAGRQILLVDDNEDAAEALAEALQEMGHSVRVAHDGPAALAMLQAFSPDIAFLDIGLPVMDGYELARRIRGERRLGGVRLVSITGYGQPNDRQRAKDAGFAVHLVKPVDLSVIERVIEGDPN